MKAKEIYDLSSEELQERLDSTKKELFNLRVQQSVGQLENPSRLRELRRDIARVNTVVTKRSMEKN